MRNNRQASNALSTKRLKIGWRQINANKSKIVSEDMMSVFTFVTNKVAGTLFAKEEAELAFA